jgi:hypothetical protein
MHEPKQPTSRGSSPIGRPCSIGGCAVQTELYLLPSVTALSRSICFCM